MSLNAWRGKLIEGFLGLLALSAVLAAWRGGMLSELEMRLYDARMRLTETLEASSRVALVSLDPSLDRSRTAEVVERVHADGPRAVGLLEHLAKPENEDILALLRALSARLGVLGRGRRRISSAFRVFLSSAQVRLDQDERLRRALADCGCAVLPAAPQARLRDVTDRALSPISAAAETAASEPVPFLKALALAPKIQASGTKPYALPEARELHFPLGPFGRAAAGVGVESFQPDADGTLRRYAPAVYYKGRVYPSYPLALAAASLELDPSSIFYLPGQEIVASSLHVPLGPAGETLISFYGPSRTYQRYASEEILGQGVPRGVFKGKIVLIGTEIPSWPTPTGSRISELEITASAVQNLIERNFIWSPPSAARWEAALWAAAGLVAVVILPAISLLWGAALVWLWLCGAMGIGAYLFAQGSWIKLAGPCLVPAAAFFILSARRFLFLALLGRRVLKEGGWARGGTLELGAVPPAARPLAALVEDPAKEGISYPLSSYQVIKDLAGPWREKRYLARHPSRPSRVLLGVLRSAAAQERNAFARRAVTLRGIRSRALAAVLDSGVDGDDAFAVADLAGEEILSLADCLRSGRDFEIPWALERSADLAEALSEVHAKGVSGVFSPFNVFVLKNGEARLAAFLGGFPLSGGANGQDSSGRPENGSGRSNLSEEVLALSYLSPEALAGKPLDGRSDIFSLGATLYELLAGRHPFLAAGAGGEGIGDLLYRVANDPPFPPREERRLAPCAEAAVLKALEKDPSRRYAGAREMAADLRACAASLRRPS